jgi:hypothetical protein
MGGVAWGIGNAGKGGNGALKLSNAPTAPLLAAGIVRLMKDLLVKLLQVWRAGAAVSIAQDVGGTVALAHRKKNLRKDHVARNLVREIDQPLPADLHCLLKGAIGKKLLRFVRE